MDEKMKRLMEIIDEEEEYRKEKTMNIYEHIDYTLLKPTATYKDIDNLCEEAIEKGCASVCIPPCFVKFAHNNFPNLTICTVIGFPFGYSTTDTKVYEARQAICDGASEIDMVINISRLKNWFDSDITEEIDKVKCAIGNATLKVIIETCYLDEEEIAEVASLVDESMADYIKTSTGFGTRGTSYEDIEIIKDNITDEYENSLKIKASGGIRTREEMEKYISMGCDRIGASVLPE